MAISFGAVGTENDAGSGSSSAAGVPAGVAAGSVIVLVGYYEGTISSLPSGFAHAAGSPVAGSGFNLVVAWKRATGNDTGSYTTTFTGSIPHDFRAARYEGVKASGDPWEADTDSGAGSSVPSLSITTVNANTQLIYGLGSFSNLNMTPPTGFTERNDGTAQGMADKALAAAGSSGAVQSSGSGGAYANWLGALIPAGAAANAEVDPSAIAAVADLPDPTLSTGSTSSATALGGVAALPAPTLSAGSALAPASIPATAALPAPTLAAGSTVSPSTIAATAAVPAPAVSTGATVTPACITVVAALPTVEVQASGAVSIDADSVTATAALPAPTLATGSTVTATVIACATTLPASTIGAGATISPATIATSATLPTAGISAGGAITISPDTITTAAVFPATRINPVLLWVRHNGQLTPITVSGAVRIAGQAIPFG